MNEILSLDDLHEAIITASAASRHLAIEDLQLACADTLSLSDTTFLAKLPVSFSQLAQRFQANPPIFIQHLCPPQVKLSLNNTDDDLQRLAEAAQLLSESLPAAKESFSVQTRILDRQADRPYRPFDLNQKLAPYFIKRGYPLDVRAPGWVLSVVIAAETSYLGLSTVHQNLNAWAGGQHRFKWQPDQISRAEFKLLEAVDLFRLDLSGGGKALDLGAAPGGWTHLLRRWGYEVWAIDPARLAPQLDRDPEIHHFRQPARQFLDRKLIVDLIVNDMRLDIEESARLLVAAAPKLKPQGLALMTMKLPQRAVRQKIEAGLTILDTAYQPLAIRQLFHNRHEVTAALRRK